MAHDNTSAALLDACVTLAISLGQNRANEVDNTETFQQLRDAIDAYVASFWYLPEGERPTKNKVTEVMVRNAYLAYLSQMGELPLDQVPEAFKVLEALYPNK